MIKKKIKKKTANKSDPSEPICVCVRERERVEVEKQK